MFSFTFAFSVQLLLDTPIKRILKVSLECNFRYKSLVHKKTSLLVKHIPSSTVLEISHYRQQVFSITKYYEEILLLVHIEVLIITKGKYIVNVGIPYFDSFYNCFSHVTTSTLLYLFT